MAEFILEAKQREVGKQSKLTNIRENSRVPGVVYGFSQEPVVMDLDYKSLLKVLKEAGTSHIVTIKLSDKEIKAIVRQYQQDPVTDKVIHIDFMAVSDKKKLTTKVPIEFVGESKAVREQGGKLNKKISTVDVKCLPSDLPEKIIVDISLFKELDQKMVIGDLEVSDKVEILNDPNNPVADVTIPKKIVLPEPSAAEEEKAEGEEGEEGAKEGEAKDEAGAKEGEAKDEAGDKSEDKK